MSRNKYYLFFLFNSLIVIQGCKKDLLDTSPYNALASSTMWTTDNLTDLGVNGVYEAVRLGINTAAASGTELYHFDRFGTSQGRDADPYLVGSMTSSSALFSEVWKELYEGVNRANTAVYALENTSPSAQEKKNRLIAEVKFLRAYFYQRLNQLYRGVPIYLEPVSVEETNRARASEVEVWQQVVRDLTDCINTEELPDKYSKGNADFGRVTKGAAYALRGKAYLYLEKWDLAIADFEKVKNLGYTLFPDYGTLFLEENEQNDEMIFSIQNLPLSGFGSTTQFFLGTRSAFGSNWNTYLVTNDVVDLYTNKDGSAFNWNAVIPGYSTLTPQEREVYFLRDNITEAERKAAVARGAKISEYLPNGNEQRIKKVYENRDPRLAYNVITPYSTFYGREVDGASRTFTLRWPYRSEAVSVLDIRYNPGTYFWYLHRKFVYTGNDQLPDRTSGGIDFPLIRLADIILMQAEAYMEVGDERHALENLNVIRKRAGVGVYPATSTGTELVNLIRNERRCELLGEGISYFDELRWHTWKTSTFYAGNGIKHIWGTVIVPYVWGGDYQSTWAIPQLEIQKNRNLIQNIGWID